MSLPYVLVSSKDISLLRVAMKAIEEEAPRLANVEEVVALLMKDRVGCQLHRQVPVKSSNPFLRDWNKRLFGGGANRCWANIAICLQETRLIAGGYASYIGKAIENAIDESVSGKRNSLAIEPSKQVLVGGADDISVSTQEVDEYLEIVALGHRRALEAARADSDYDPQVADRLELRFQEELSSLRRNRKLVEAEIRQERTHLGGLVEEQIMASVKNGTIILSAEEVDGLVERVAAIERSAGALYDAGSAIFDLGGAVDKAFWDEGAGSPPVIEVPPSKNPLLKGLVSKGLVDCLMECGMRTTDVANDVSAQVMKVEDVVGAVDAFREQHL